MVGHLSEYSAHETHWLEGNLAEFELLAEDSDRPQGPLRRASGPAPRSFRDTEGPGHIDVTGDGDALEAEANGAAEEACSSWTGCGRKRRWLGNAQDRNAVLADSLFGKGRSGSLAAVRSCEASGAGQRVGCNIAARESPACKGWADGMPRCFEGTLVRDVGLSSA